MTSPTPDPTQRDMFGLADQPLVSDSKDASPPASNAGWAVVSLLCFWPLAFSAFTHAFNVFPLWASGNTEGARYASDRVRRLGQLSLWIAGALLVLLVVVYTVVAIVLITQGGDFEAPREGIEQGRGFLEDQGR